jgi:hypothetical protein
MDGAVSQTATTYPGIAEQDVQPAEMRHRARYHVFHLLRLRQIDGDKHRLCATRCQIVSQSFAVLRVAVSNHHSRSLADKRLGTPFADPAGCARDEGNFTL